MKRIYDFRCPDGHVVEKFISDSICQITCEVCQQVATRVCSYGGPMLDHISGDFPAQTLKWARWRQAKIAAERKAAH